MKCARFHSKELIGSNKQSDARTIGRKFELFSKIWKSK